MKKTGVVPFGKSNPTGQALHRAPNLRAKSSLFFHRRGAETRSFLPSVLTKPSVFLCALCVSVVILLALCSGKKAY